MSNKKNHSKNENLINLYRTIATDDTLARAIKEELNKRGVFPDKSCESINGDVMCREHVALISEWDTVFGRSFQETIQNAFEDQCNLRHGGRNSNTINGVFCNSKSQWLDEYHYLRGLDGQTAAAAERAKKADKSATSPEKETNTLDLIKTRISGKDNATVSESPEGPVQFDYLRRIADEMTAKDKVLRAHGSAIKAIGVVGTDVFDKLLVLQALRPYFPGALFFTTDLDAALTLPSERDLPAISLSRRVSA